MSSCQNKFDCLENEYSSTLKALLYNLCILYDSIWDKSVAIVVNKLHTIWHAENNINIWSAISKSYHFLWISLEFTKFWKHLLIFLHAHIFAMDLKGKWFCDKKPQIWFSCLSNLRNPIPFLISRSDVVLQ